MLTVQLSQHVQRPAKLLPYAGPLNQSHRLAQAAHRRIDLTTAVIRLVDSSSR